MVSQPEAALAVGQSETLLLLCKCITTLTSTGQSLQNQTRYCSNIQ